MGGPNKTSPRSLLAAERAEKALDLRKAGAGYSAIGKALGVSAQAAHKMVKKHLEKLNDGAQNAAAELRQLELERLDALTLALWPKARAGDVRAVAEVRALGTERRKLLGLDAPIKTALMGAEGGPIETKTALTGPDGGPLQSVGATLDITRLDSDRLATLYAMLQDLQAGAGAPGA